MGSEWNFAEWNFAPRSGKVIAPSPCLALREVAGSGHNQTMLSQKKPYTFAPFL
jgi:hypothetical protein